MDEHVCAYYEGGVELDRLQQGYSRIEFARTKELLEVARRQRAAASSSQGTLT